MMAAEFRCAALNKNGGRCQARAVEATDWWRCARHANWYDTATQADIEKLAWLEIEEVWGL